MNETAARLRAQKACSTDPEYLERMALHYDVQVPAIAREKMQKTTDAEETRKDK